MPDNLSRAWTDAQKSQPDLRGVRVVMPVSAYNMMARFYRYAEGLALHLEEVCNDPAHQALMREAARRGYTMYSENLMRSDAKLLMDLLRRIGPVAVNPDRDERSMISVPKSHIKDLYCMMDGVQHVTDKMTNIFRTSDYLGYFRVLKAENRPYEGPSAMKEWLILRIGARYIEARLKRDMKFDRKGKRWKEALAIA